MKDRREDAIELLNNGKKLKDISEFTGLSLNAVKKISQMLKLYNKVDDIKLKEYLVELKHDALLYSSFKTKDELTDAIEYVLVATDNKKIPRAKLKSLLERFASGKVTIQDNVSNTLSTKDKLLKLVEHIEYLENNYPEDVLNKIGIVNENDLGEDHLSYFVLKHKISGPTRAELLEKRVIVYDPKTFYYYIPKVILLLSFINEITFGDEFRKPCSIDKNIIMNYVENL